MKPTMKPVMNKRNKHDHIRINTFNIELDTFLDII